MKSLIYRASHEVTLSPFTGIDSYFAGLMAEIEGTVNINLCLAAAVTSHLTGRGHICADLRKIAGERLSRIMELEEGDSDRELPSLAEWRKCLLGSKTVGRPGEYRPLILDPADRLYLYRYWEYENRLAGMIRGMAGKGSGLTGDSPFTRDLRLLFPGNLPAKETHWQRISAAAALTGKLTVLSGGPGTGKSSTLIKAVLLLMKRGEESGRKIRVALTAPTGKAAGRLKEAIGELSGLFPGSDHPAELLENVHTIHRLLVPRYGTPYFRYNAERKLPYDMVVVDECSMIDLPLMCKLFDAISETSSLVLLGDKDQLASIEAGAVFADICDAGAKHLYSPSLGERIESAAGEIVPEKIISRDEPEIADSLFILEKSYRFAGESGIGILSRLIKEGDSQAAMKLLLKGEYPDCRYTEINTGGSLDPLLEERVPDAYRGYLEAATPEEAFQRLSSFRILAALRKGPWGVEYINGAVERILRRRGLIKPYGEFYHNKPLLITRNDYRRMLFNGDTGVLFQQEDDIYAFFPSQDRVLRRMSTGILPEHETSYAMTIHKSQGSEFDTLLLIIPPYSSPLLSRELLYTGLTRAKKSVEIWGNRGVISGALENPIRRSSGLRESLWE